MGIEKEVADFCLASVGFNSIERALTYKYEKDEQGKLIHEFVAGIAGCYICEREADDHAHNLISHTDSRSKKNKNMLTDKDKVPQG